MAWTHTPVFGVAAATHSTIPLQALCPGTHGLGGSRRRGFSPPLAPQTLPHACHQLQGTRCPQHYCWKAVCGFTRSHLGCPPFSGTGGAVRPVPALPKGSLCPPLRRGCSRYRVPSHSCFLAPTLGSPCGITSPETIMERYQGTAWLLVSRFPTEAPPLPKIPEGRGGGPHRVRCPPGQLGPPHATSTGWGSTAKGWHRKGTGRPLDTARGWGQCAAGLGGSTGSPEWGCSVGTGGGMWV